MANHCSRDISLSSSVSLAVLYGVASLPAILGNTAFLWVMHKSRTIRTAANVLLSSLALADLLVGLVIDPVWIARCVLSPRPVDHPFRIVIDFLWIQTSVTTTFSLCVVSLDRYIAVRFSLSYSQIVTQTRCYFAISLVWIVSIVFGMARVMIKNPNNLPTLWMCVTVITFLLPMVLIFLFYSFILGQARKQSRNIAHLSAERHGAQLAAERVRNRKATKTAGLIVALFFVSWFPSLVTSFVNLTTNDHCTKQRMRLVWLWVELVAFGSSGINPWLYSLRNNAFKVEMKKVFGKSRCPILNKKEFNGPRLKAATFKTEQKKDQINSFYNTRNSRKPWEAW